VDGRRYSDEHQTLRLSWAGGRGSVVFLSAKLSPAVKMAALPCDKGAMQLLMMDICASARIRCHFLSVQFTCSPEVLAQPLITGADNIMVRQAAAAASSPLHPSGYGATISLLVLSHPSVATEMPGA
jgi:hypothetical protein